MLGLEHRPQLRHRPLIEKTISKAKNKFKVQVYEMTIVYNHIHLLIKGKARTDLQNFFRVVAGHIAQEILRKHPIEQRAKNQNLFWISRLYSRVVSWGNEYFIVRRYVIQNNLESLGIIPYQERKAKKRKATAR